MSDLEFKNLQFFHDLATANKCNQMIDILAELFQKSDEDEIDSISYFLVGDIAADYRHIRLSMGEELTKSSISLALGLCKEEVEAKFQRIGDLGSLAARL